MPKPIYIRATFIGQHGSMGYRHGEIYILRVDGNAISKVGDRRNQRCPYESVNSFLTNWTGIGRLA